MAWLGAINDTVQIVAVVAGLYFGFRGLDSWRSEMRGRRSADLAVGTLAMFYEAEASVGSVRAAYAFAGEGTSRPGRSEDEPDALRRRRDGYYVPLERLQKQKEFWARFFASRYPFQAEFGAQAAQPFETMRRTLNDVMGAAYDLIEIYSDMRPRAAERSQDEVRELERTIGWGRAKDDAVAPQISAAVRSMEEFCRPIIAGYHKPRPPWWWPRRN